MVVPLIPEESGIGVGNMGPAAVVRVEGVLVCLASFHMNGVENSTCPRNRCEASKIYRGQKSDELSYGF